MKKTYDYQSLYQNWYKKLPTVCFFAILLPLALASFIVGIIILAGAEYYNEYGLGLGILFGGLIFSAVLAVLSSTITAISISQKVVATDALLSLKEGSNASAVEDTLPEL